MKKKRVIAVALILALALSAPCALAFSDTGRGEWYDGYVEKLTWLNVISGFPDGSFRPGSDVKRGEFLKMLTISAELCAMSWNTEAHWAQPYWQMAYEAGLLTDETINAGGTVTVSSPLFACTFQSLEQSITRYEMAYLISATLSEAFYERRVTVTNAEANIKDYASISSYYRDPVEQAYGKGILTGFDDGTFRGGETLTRAQAAAVIVRLLWGSERQPASFAEEQGEWPLDTTYESFAIKYRSMTVEQRRLALFGDANKTYFSSAAEAAPYMTSVTVPAWKLNSAGVKYESTITLTVHKLVAQEVALIFQEIFNDPERFPIATWGGARFTDSLRHSWGCAIDLNYDQNYYCRVSNGVTTAITGSLWQPGVNPYSITSGGSVVRAFAKYGWGWGGQGWSGGYYDYMHFSILATGG